MAFSADITTPGKRLLAQIVDERARAGYSRPYALTARSRNAADGFQAISYSRLANAVNRLSWWLETVLSQDEVQTQSFAYFGPNDLRYIIFVLAAMKTGRRILICSPRNTIDAQITLFEKANCRTLIHCTSVAQSFHPLFEATSGIAKVNSLSLGAALAEDAVPHYPYDLSFDLVTDLPFATLHSSGSSGDPKPISWNKAFISTLDSAHLVPVDQGVQLTKSFATHQELLVLLPLFHAGGLWFSMLPGLYEMTLVLGHPDVWFSPDYLAELLQQNTITAMLSPPSIIEELSKSSLGVEGLAKLKHVGYAGGPLHRDIGKQLAPKLQHFFSILGATEYGYFHLIQGPNKNWDSLQFYSGLGYRFDETSDGIFELVIVSDDKTNKYHGVFEVYRNVREYRTKDLYSPVTGEPGWLRYQGRADDLIALSNGEKVNPIPMENIIRTHPSVRAALVVGEYRFNPSLLIEMEEEFTPKTALDIQSTIKQIWPLVQEANKIAPGYAKIPESLVLFATASKPFRRAGKGTVQRQNTVKLYEKELDQLYYSAEMGLLLQGLTIEKSASAESIKSFTRDLYKQVLEVGDLADDEDIFDRGMDSLRVTVVVSRLRAALRSCEVCFNLADVDTRLVYSNPTVDRLAESISPFFGEKQAIRETKWWHGTPSRRSKIEALLEKYSADLPASSASQNSQDPRQPWKVILTGTTGSLGSYLFATLQSMPKSQVSKIYCLNRTAKGLERQKKVNQSRGLNIPWDDDRVEFLHANTTQPRLGLDNDKYTELQQEATVIIHCAWRVDFNLSLESFETQINGVKQLLDFSYHSKHKATFIFISSISTALGWLAQHPEQKVPEGILQNIDAPAEMGYGESKYVSERLIEKYCKATSIPTAIFRTGQIAGPVLEKGQWNKQEWFPTLIASSKYMQALPNSLGNMSNIDFIPVDLLARIITQLTASVLAQSSKQTLVYNLVNPNVTPWSSLLPVVQELIQVPRTVSIGEWVKLLQESSIGAFNEKNPAVKLVDYFRMLGESEGPEGGDEKQKFEVAGLMRDSEEASTLRPAGAEWMQLWMDQWGF